MPPQDPELVPAERWAEAALWREVAVRRLAGAVAALEEAVAGMPVSVERVAARRALSEAVGVLATCRAGAREARAREVAARAGTAQS